MKSIVKFSFAICLGAMLLNICSCSKKHGPAPEPNPNYGLTTTFAGSAGAGFNNGLSTSATFNAPAGVDIDAAGDIYVADSYNHSIRKITPDGMVTTLAGNGNMGSANGIGAAASFNYPNGVAVDRNGNVYVADSNNNMIRKIAPNGEVTTLAGSVTAGSDNGAGGAAKFHWPNAVAVDAAGNIYVADADNNMIRKITPAGLVSTLAGSGAAGSADGMGTGASFNNPQDIALDNANNVYVADGSNQVIRKITPEGMVTTFAGNGTEASVDGNLKTASFNFPDALSFDSEGNLFVADERSGVIRKITPSGVVSTLAGNSLGFANGIGAAALFNEPFGLAVDKADNLYIGDTGNNLIRKIIAKE